MTTFIAGIGIGFLVGLFLLIGLLVWGMSDPRTYR